MTEPRDLRAFALCVDGIPYVVFDHALEGTEGRRALSAAEREIAVLLEQGLTDREIAAHRGVTRSTLTKQLHSIFRKLGVRSRRELAARPR